MLLYSKEPTRKEQIAYRMGEYLCQLYVRQKFDIYRFKELHKLITKNLQNCLLINRPMNLRDSSPKTKYMCLTIVLSVQRTSPKRKCKLKSL